jgi:hypothetical protein
MHAPDQAQDGCNMADQTSEHASEETPEYLAYRLFLHIADLETKNLHGDPARDRTVADRKWVLDTYAECLQAVRSPESRKRELGGGT